MRPYFAVPLESHTRQEAIMNHLLIETMKVEKKEFEGQKRSNENDIIFIIMIYQSYPVNKQQSNLNYMYVVYKFK
jgi:hypothetical protein